MSPPKVPHPTILLPPTTHPRAKMAQLQVLSDLHLETPAAYDIFDITPTAPYLALLGDIGNTKDEGFFDFLCKQVAKFQVVFFVIGNHEPYHSTHPKSKARLQQFQKQIAKERANGNTELGRFVFLDQTRFDLSSSITLLGCTLFSNVDDAHKDYVNFGMNDFFHIKGWDIDQHIENHKSELQWLNEQVTKITEDDPERRIIILTHYSPTVDSRANDPKHSGSKIFSGFVTDLSKEICYTSKQVVAWAFGHTHYNCDFVDETTGTRFFTNQRGYYFAQAGLMEMGKVLEV